MKGILFFCLAIAIYSFSSAQQLGPFISFDKEEHDFGDIKEDDGKVSIKFTFINTGSQPLIVNDVRASCGCTTPEWTKEPVNPGEKGYITATFDPANRPGKFTKTITVNSNSSENASKMLKITGNVLPKQATIEAEFPRNMGEGLRLKSNMLGFGTVLNTQQQSKSVEIINSSETEPIKVTFASVPAHLTVRSIPEILKPLEKGVVEIVYDGTKVNEWGYVINTIQFVVNGKTSGDNAFKVNANIKEDFSKMTPEQLANAPKIAFNEEVFDFGSAGQNTQIEHLYEFKNNGNSDLIIRKVKSTCGCTVVNTSKDVIKPGETGSLKAIFSTGTRSGNQSKIITVISNDPIKSMIQLYLKGTISGNVVPGQNNDEDVE